MRMLSFESHHLLAPYIHSFCYNERLFAHPNDTFDILPDSMIELVYGFGTPCQMRRGDQTCLLPTCYMVGLLDAPVRIAAAGLVRTIRARLYPWGVWPLIGTSLDQSQTAMLPGLIWPGDFLADLAPTLETALDQGSERAISILEHTLIDGILTHSLQDPIFVAAAQQILAENGNIVVEDLARATGSSPRALRRTFHSLLGIGPKVLARTARFEYVRDTLWERPDSILSEVALDAGYADQAHMQREFRQLSQRTPRQFAEEMRQTRLLFVAQNGRNLQDI